jgi:hypothetical protein
MTLPQPMLIQAPPHAHYDVTPELRPPRNSYVTTGRYLCCAPLIAEG